MEDSRRNFTEVIPNYISDGVVMKTRINKITSNKVTLMFLFVLYRLILDIAFRYVVSERFGYMGFILDVNVLKIIESYVILIVFSLFLDDRIEKPSSFFVIFLYSMIIVPLTSVYALQNQPREFIYYVLISFIFIIIFKNTKIVKMAFIKNGKQVVLFSTFIVGSALFIWIIFKGGLRYLNFDLFKVYDFRRTVAELVFPGNMAYLMTWFGKVMNPFFIAYNLWNKNKKGVVFSIGVQVLFFGITAHKAMLFYPVVILFIYFASKSASFAKFIPLGLASLNALALASYYFLNNGILITLFTRRVLLVNAKYHYSYFNFFNENGFVYYSNRSWFPEIIKYPYSEPIQLIITGGSGEWANAGFLANGYAHFGLLGMIVYSIIVGILFRYIDYLASYYLPKWLCIAIMVTPILSLTSADLPTALLNHGILIAFIILWLMSSEKEKSSIKRYKHVERIKI